VRRPSSRMRVQIVLAIILVAGVSALPTNNPLPKFPLDWSAYEVDLLIQNQGAYQQQGNLLCCPLNDNCQVQTQYQAGNTYFDFSNNRSRSDVGGGQSIFNMYTLQKELLVVDGTCKEYCPMEGDVMTPFGPDSNATYQGQKVVNGIKCDDWQWKETVFGVMVMEISDMYVDNSGAAPVPVQEVDQLTPFGQAIGAMTSTWTNFVGGPIDPNLFNIQGVDSCPMSSQCQGPMQQMHRLRSKRYKSWAFYEYQDSVPENLLPEDSEADESEEQPEEGADL